MIKRLTVEHDDFARYRNWMKAKGFISANYFSMNGYDTKKLKAQAMEGKINAIKCQIGNSVKWYYAERQAEMAYLRGEVR